MKLCQHCNKKVNEKDLFCGECGHKVEGEQASLKNSTTDEPATKGASKPIGQATTSTTEDKGRITQATGSSQKETKEEFSAEQAKAIAETPTVTKPQKSKLPAILLVLMGIGVGIIVSYFLNKDDTNPIATDEVVADANETNSDEVEETPEEVPKKKNLLKTKGKEKVPVSDIENEAAKVFSGKSGELAYDLYLVQENVSEAEGDGDYARFEDVLETSDIVFYLAEQGNDVAYRQEQLESFEFMRNLTNQSASAKNWYEELVFPDYSLIALYEYFDIFSYREIHLFDVIEGEVKRINLGDFRYAWYYPQIKTINDDKIQLVILDEDSEDKWFFDTYEYDRKNVRMEHYNEKVFDKYDVLEGEVAKAIFENWEANEDAYVPYTKAADRKVWDIKSIVRSAIEGRLGDVPVELGNSMIDIYDKNKAIEYIYENPSGVAPYVAVYYDTYIVGYEPLNPDIILESNDIQLDFRGNVSFIKIPGEYLTFTMDDVKKELGKPDQDVRAGEHLMGDEHDYYGYDMGTHTLIIKVNKAANEIEDIQLAIWDVIEYVGLLDPESYEAKLSQQR